MRFSHYTMTAIAATFLTLLSTSVAAQDFPDCRTETNEASLTIANKPAKLADDHFAYHTDKVMAGLSKTFYEPSSEFHSLVMYVEVLREGYVRFHNLSNPSKVKKVFTISSNAPNKITKYVYLFGDDSCRLKWDEKVASLDMATLVPTHE